MSDTSCLDRGLTHLALVVREMDRSREFYEAFAGLRLVHERPAAGLINRVAWLADPHTAFTVVLIESKQLADTPLGPFGHLGMACASRAQVDRLADLARREAFCDLRRSRVRIRWATGPTSAIRTGIRWSFPMVSRSVSPASNLHRQIRSPPRSRPSFPTGWAIK